MAGDQVKTVIRLKLRFADLREFIGEYSPWLTPDGLIVFTENPVATGSLVRFEILSRDGARFIAGEGVVSRSSPRTIELGGMTPIDGYGNTVVVSKVAPGGLGVLRAMARHRGLLGVSEGGQGVTAPAPTPTTAPTPEPEQVAPAKGIQTGESSPVAQVQGECEAPARGNGGGEETARAASSCRPSAPATVGGEVAPFSSPPGAGSRLTRIIAATKQPPVSVLEPEPVEPPVKPKESKVPRFLGVLARLFSRPSKNAGGQKPEQTDRSGEEGGEWSLDGDDLDFRAWAEEAANQGVQSPGQDPGDSEAAPVLNLSSLQQVAVSEGEGVGSEVDGGDRETRPVVGGSVAGKERGRELNRLLAQVLQPD